MSTTTAASTPGVWIPFVPTSIQQPPWRVANVTPSFLAALTLQRSTTSLTSMWMTAHAAFLGVRTRPSRITTQARSWITAAQVSSGRERQQRQQNYKKERQERARHTRKGEPPVVAAAHFGLRKQAVMADLKQRELLVAFGGRGRGGHDDHRCLLALIARWLY